MILVVGATGLLGGRVASLLVKRGEQVRSLVRRGSSAPSWGGDVDVAMGDLTDPTSLSAACAGVDTVVATATAIGRRLAGAGGPSIREVDELGMLALVGAAETAGVARFVYVSYAGVDAGLGMPIERAKLAVERRLATSRMQRVVVRPDAFQDVHLMPLGRFDVARGRVAVFGRGDVPQRWVNVEDVAALLASLAVESDPPGLVELGGPEALSRNAAIEVAARATGRPMKRQAMPLWVARLGMRLLARPNDALASLFGLRRPPGPATGALGREPLDQPRHHPVVGERVHRTPGAVAVLSTWRAPCPPVEEGRQARHGVSRRLLRNLLNQRAPCTRPALACQRGGTAEYPDIRVFRHLRRQGAGCLPENPPAGVTSPRSGRPRELRYQRRTSPAAALTNQWRLSTSCSLPGRAQAPFLETAPGAFAGVLEPVVIVVAGP